MLIHKQEGMSVSEIKHEFPPNFADILAKFPTADNGHTIFAYAPYIYNPSGEELPAALIAHEETHIRRQANNPAEWWKNYIHMDDFRLKEEVIAHEAEARTTLDRIGWNRKNRKKVAAITGERMAHPMYQYPKLSIKKATTMVYLCISIRS